MYIGGGTIIWERQVDMKYGSYIEGTRRIDELCLTRKGIDEPLSV